MTMSRSIPLTAALLLSPLALAQVEEASLNQAPPAEAQPESAPRRWLLREGSLLVQARGTMGREAGTNWWQFTIRDEVDARVKQTLGLLPCSLLDEMVRVEESLPGREVVFEVTGQIYVYRGRNFLLPTIAPQLIEYGPAQSADDSADEPSTDESTTDDETATDEAIPEAADDSGGDSVEDIISDLESSVGSLARSPASASTGTDEPIPEAAGYESLVREQTMLLSRRGQVTRTTSGAWLFVFDADAQGLADPPMILMPCLLLEHLEQRVWRNGANVPVLISGRAYVFQNRNYLVPTAFQIAREKTPMTR